jgi:hypothetical protein
MAIDLGQPAPAARTLGGHSNIAATVIAAARSLIEGESYGSRSLANFANPSIASSLLGASTL